MLTQLVAFVGVSVVVICTPGPDTAVTVRNTLLGGRLADLFGQRLLFLIGIVSFTVASAACGLALSQEMLIVARAAQGAPRMS